MPRRSTVLRHPSAMGVVTAMMAIALVATACSGSEPVAPTTLAFEEPSLPTRPLERPAVIGVAMQNLSRTFFQGLESGARGQAELHGAELIISDADDDAMRQAQDVAAMIEAGVDGVILSPVDSAAATQIADMAAAAGVPILAVANQIGTVAAFGPQFVYPGTMALVTNDDVDMGRKAAGIAASLIGTEVPKIGIIEGKTGTANAVMRYDGFTSELESLGIEFEVVASQPGDWTGDGGSQVCAEFASIEELTIVFSMSDAMTAGCVSALDAAGRDDIAIVSIGGNAAGIELLLDRAIAGTVCQKPGAMGALAVETMVAALEVAEFDQGLRFYETPVVTAENQATVCIPQW